MKRTIATKMIVMSNEFSTRGSMPGAIRSEIITRSSACTAMRTSPPFVTTSTIGLHAGAAQERRQQPRPHRERGEQHVLVRGVRATALDPEPVEHRHPQRRDEVPVGAAAARTG